MYSGGYFGGYYFGPPAIRDYFPPYYFGAAWETADPIPIARPRGELHKRRWDDQDLMDILTMISGALN